jgi:hypothetical protein
MKNKQQEKNKLNKFTPENLERLRYFVKRLEYLRENRDINLETVKEFDMVISELLIMRSGFVENLLNWAKQDYIIE